MDAKKGSFLIAFSLLFCFQRSAAHPIGNLSPAKELASMEALLQRLEEKISLTEDLRDNPDFEDPETQRGGDLSEFGEDEEPSNQQPRPEPRDSSVPMAAPSGRDSLLKRMRGLQAARSMRESGCFGRRLDRIGSVSGMGCRGSRRN